MINQYNSTTYACINKVDFVSFSACVFLAIETQSNLRLVQKLLDSMQRALERGQYEHVGSQQLWTSHCVTVSKLQNRLDSLHIAEVCSSLFLVSFCFIFILFLLIFCFGYMQ